VKTHNKRYLDRTTTDFLSCLEEKGELSKPTSKEIKTHIKLLTYNYTLSSSDTDWINETNMLLIGAFASALISSLSSSFKISLSNLFIFIIFIILIYIRAKRR